MTYDLPAIVRQSGRRKPRPIRVRGHTLAQERQFLAILARVVTFWRGQIRQLEPTFTFDAMPEPRQIEAAGAEANLMVAALIRDLQEWAARSAGWVALNWVQRVRAETGVDLSLLATSQEGNAAVRAAVEWAVALIRDLNDQTRNRLVGALADITARGVPQKEAAEIVRGVLQSSRRRAELIASDQTQKIVAKLNKAQQLEAGVTKYVWNHSFLPNARRHHVERQGNVYQWAKPPRGGHPGTEINCRCTAAALPD